MLIFVLIGPADFDLYAQFLILLHYTYCQFDLLSCLTRKISLSFWGATGVLLNAACCGGSETLVFTLIWWMVEEKSNCCFIGVLIPLFIAKALFVSCWFPRDQQKRLLLSNPKHFVSYWLVRCVLIYGQATCLTVFWKMSISSLIMHQGRGCLWESRRAQKSGFSWVTETLTWWTSIYSNEEANII